MAWQALVQASDWAGMAAEREAAGPGDAWAAALQQTPLYQVRLLNQDLKHEA